MIRAWAQEIVPACSAFRVSGSGQQHLQRRTPGLLPGQLPEPVQAGIRQITQQIGRERTRLGFPGRNVAGLINAGVINAGLISVVLPGTAEDSRRGNGSGDGR
jgi:hypothetical protein